MERVSEPDLERGLGLELERGLGTQSWTHLQSFVELEW